MTTMSEKHVAALKKVHATLSNVVGDDVEMSVDKFFGYVNDQIAKAVGESREAAVPRLKALRAAIEKAVTDIGVMSATNTASENIKVSVYTEDTTAADELTSKEMTPTQAANAGGGGPALPTFKAAQDAIASIKKALGAEPEKPAAAASAPVAKKSGEASPARLRETTLAKNDGVDNDGWPENLNDPRYRETQKSTTAPTFGYDSEGAPND